MKRISQREKFQHYKEFVFKKKETTAISDSW